MIDPFVARARELGCYTPLPVHPVADAFPLMPDDALEHLASSIKIDGQIRKIVLYADDKYPDGRILDGRNRYLACLLAKVEPQFRTITEPMTVGDLCRYVDAENCRRRHLDAIQQAICPRRLIKLCRTRKEREKYNPVLPGIADVPDVDHATDVVMGGTDELRAALERGDVGLSQAVAIAQMPADEQRAALVEIAKPDKEPATSPKVEANRSTAVELSAIDLAALRALVFAGEASVHGIVKAGAALVRRMVPGV